MLKVAYQARATSVETTTLGRAFSGGNPIVHDLNPAVVTQTIPLEGGRRNIAYDPQRLRMTQLETLWMEVEQIGWDLKILGMREDSIDNVCSLASCE